VLQLQQSFHAFTPTTSGAASLRASVAILSAPDAGSTARGTLTGHHLRHDRRSWLTETARVLRALSVCTTRTNLAGLGTSFRLQSTATPRKMQILAFSGNRPSPKKEKNHHVGRLRTM
jgi:hypothetical protein